MMLFTLQLLDPVIHAVEKLLMTADCLCALSTPSSRVPLRGGCRDQDCSATKRQSDVLFCAASATCQTSLWLPGVCQGILPVLVHCAFARPFVSLTTKLGGQSMGMTGHLSDDQLL